MDGDKAKYSFLDNPAGKNGSNLSGGQKAIVHLLRLDLNDISKIIILDEVTSALDNQSRDSIIEYIKYLRSKEKTIFIISHDTFMDTIYDIKISFSSQRNPIIL
jgi:ABC-type bacteriocin/lantibiotic exporter with double-glycine peptidase domain